MERDTEDPVYSTALRDRDSHLSLKSPDASKGVHFIIIVINFHLPTSTPPSPSEQKGVKKGMNGKEGDLIV